MNVPPVIWNGRDRTFAKRAAQELRLRELVARLDWASEKLGDLIIDHQDDKPLWISLWALESAVAEAAEWTAVALAELREGRDD